MSQNSSMALSMTKLASSQHATQLPRPIPATAVAAETIKSRRGDLLVGLSSFILGAGFFHCFLFQKWAEHVTRTVARRTSNYFTLDSRGAECYRERNCPYGNLPPIVEKPYRWRSDTSHPTSAAVHTLR